MMNYRNAKLLIFDLDGTLADTLEGIAAGVNAALAECGYPPRTAEHIRRSIGNGPLMLCRRVLPDALYDDTAAAERLYPVYRRAYTQTYRMTREPYAGLREVLAALKKRGYLIAVLSNKQDELVADMTARLFPEGEVTAAWGTNEQRHGKPDPAGALELCQALGVKPEEAVMIGDGETDYAVSVRAGMMGHVIVTWGFRPREALEAVGATNYADTAEELLQYFH